MTLNNCQLLLGLKCNKSPDLYPLIYFPQTPEFTTPGFLFVLLNKPGYHGVTKIKLVCILKIKMGLLVLVYAGRWDWFGIFIQGRPKKVIFIKFLFVRHFPLVKVQFFLFKYFLKNIKPLGII